MIKYFCDKCEREITSKTECSGPSEFGRLGTTIDYEVKGVRHVLAVELMQISDGTSNAGLFCKYCILDAFSKLDDRPTSG